MCKNDSHKKDIEDFEKSIENLRNAYGNAYENWYKYPGVCPNCGRCPVCGRPHDIRPYWYDPIQVTWSGSGTQTI